MLGIYDYGFYKFKLTTTENEIFNSENQILLYDGFLQNYTLHSDSYFYPNLLYNDTLLRVFMNDNYNTYSLNNLDLIATKTSYTLRKILANNDWIIDGTGILQQLPTENINNYNIYKQYSSYLGNYASIINSDDSNNSVNSFPYKNTTLSIRTESNETLIKLSDYFTFTINTDIEPSQIIFHGNLDNGKFI